MPQDNNTDRPVGLECPECGGQEFSYILRQVQFADAYETRDGTRSVEAYDQGPIVGDDINEEGLYCTECDDAYDMVELVPVSETPE